MSHTVMTYYLMTQGRQSCRGLSHPYELPPWIHVTIFTITLVTVIPATVDTVPVTADPGSDSGGVCGKWTFDSSDVYIYVAVCVQDLILDFNWLNHYQASITMGSCVSYHWRKQQNPPTSSSIANQLTHAILLVSFAQKKWVCASDYFSGKVQWLPR